MVVCFLSGISFLGRFWTFRGCGVCVCFTPYSGLELSISGFPGFVVLVILVLVRGDCVWYTIEFLVVWMFWLWFSFVMVYFEFRKFGILGLFSVCSGLEFVDFDILGLVVYCVWVFLVVCGVWG